MADDRLDGHVDVLRDLYPHTGNAWIVGITGNPGAGKSTLTDRLVAHWRAGGLRIGVVAVDPSSPFSGGAILGDRVRMGDLATDDGVFIRSLATRGSLGGLARAALDTADILDAAGYDVVLIETVGVGQDEVDIATAAHTVIVVSAPGLGDGIQAIKAGVLEIADVHVVSKADRADAQKTVGDLKAMLGLGLAGRGPSAWTVPVIPTSAETGEGVDKLIGAIDAHGEHLHASGELEKRRRKIAEMRVLKTAQDIVRDRIEAGREGSLGPLMEKTAAREIDPATAAHELLRNLKLES